MSKTPTPSAAAMRLAQKIWGDGTIPLTASVKEVAAFIDAETGLPELLELVEDAVPHWSFLANHMSLSEAERQGARRRLSAARAAIAKARSAEEPT